MENITGVCSITFSQVLEIFGIRDCITSVKSMMNFRLMATVMR